MQNPVKNLIKGIPFLLAGLVMGYWFHDFREHPAMPNPAVAQSGELEQPTAQVAQAMLVPDITNLKSLVREANENRWSDDSQSRLRSGIEALSLAEIQPALDGLNEVGDFRERASIFKQIVRRWAELEPRAAFDYLNSFGEGEIKSQAMAEVAR